jgi:hypothetical protein
MSFYDTPKSVFTESSYRLNKKGGKNSPHPLVPHHRAQRLNLALQENGDHEAVKRQRFEQRETQHQR